MNEPDSAPKFDLPKWPPEWPEILQAAQSAILSGDWGRYDSPIRTAFCDEIAELFAADTVRLVPSGSAAVELALRATGVSEGDEVILSAYDYPGNFRAIELCGATPVLVDVMPGRVVINPNQIAESVSPATKAVIASHLFGTAAPVGLLRKKCDEHSLVLIEDVCQTPGMLIGGQFAGSFGDIATLSFGGSKPLTAGNGGAILTSNDRFAARLGPLLDRPSEAYGISPLQCAVLRPQLKKLPAWAKARAANAGFIAETLRYTESPVRPIDHNDDPPGVVEPSHYKFAFTAESAEHRSEIIRRAYDAGLPVGAGFRTTAGTSDRRCRKPVPLNESVRLSATVCVLSHEALMTPPPNHQHLASELSKIVANPNST